MASILLVTSDFSSMSWSWLGKFEAECWNGGWQYDSGELYPIVSMKSSDDWSSLAHNIRTETYIDSYKTNPTYLVG